MAAAALLAAGMVSCVKETAVYDAGAAEIGFTPVSYHITKGLPGPMDGTVYDGNETFGIFAWHKITAQPQSWQDFYNDGTPGAGVTYIDGEPFAKNPTSKYWAGGYNELSILVDRVEDASVPGGKKRETVTTVDVASNVHDPHYWPKTGYLAFAGYSPYYRLEITKVPGEDGKMDLEYDASTMLSSGDCNVSYVPDGTAPYLKIENFTQGDYEWGEDDHWATNETCDLMWFDADDQVLTSNWQTMIAGTSDAAVPVSFKHACAWLDFRFRAADGTADGKFVILKATLSDMYWKGDFVSDDGNGASAWTGLEDTRDIVLFYNLGDGNADRTSKFNYITYEDYLQAGKMMVIPQPVSKTSAGGGTQTARSTLTIYYKQLTSDTPYEPAHEIYVEGQDEVVDEEATLNSGTPLTEVFTCEMTASADGTWQRGKHYVYDVVFGLDEILVSPSVEDWDDVDTSVPVK